MLAVLGRFEVLDVRPGRGAVRAAGRSGKEWLRERGTSIADGTNERDRLFKPILIQADGHRQGGDRSEKPVAELGVPCAEVEHVDGPDAPVHLRFLARLEGSVPAGWLPMTGPDRETFTDWS